MLPETEECQICCEEIKETSFKFKECGHSSLCVDCVKKYTWETIRNGNFEIRCPIDGCKKHLSFDEIIYFISDSEEKLTHFAKVICNSYISEKRNSSKYCRICNDVIILFDNKENTICQLCQKD